MIDNKLLKKLQLNVTDYNLDGRLFRVTGDINDVCLDMKNYFFPYYQGKTGYCWLESTLQIISLYVKRKTGENILFDDEYLIFFDKLEKVNFFLESIIRESKVPITSNLNNYLLRNAMTDRGQWNMARNLIEKYGLVVKESSTPLKVINTSELNNYLTQLLKKATIYIRSNIQDEKKINSYRNELMQDVFDILVSFFENKCDIFLESDSEETNPVKFFRNEIGFPFDEYVSVCPIGEDIAEEIEILCDGNIFEKQRNRFLQVLESDFSYYMDMTIKEDGFCWCTGDFGKYFIKEKHILDDGCVTVKKDLKQKVQIEGLGRGKLWRYKLTSMTHAFVITKGAKGYYAYDSSYNLDSGDICWISNSWASKYLLQAIVKRKFIKEFSKREKIGVYSWEFF